MESRNFNGKAWLNEVGDVISHAQTVVETFTPVPAPDSANAPLPIAAGEVLTRRQAFLPWIERRAVDIIQPDATKCGGLSEARRIAWMADDHGIQMVSHGWNTAVGLAADLHLAAAMPVARYVEYLTPAPYIEGILTELPRLDEEGMLGVPQGPGLGIEVDREALKRFSGR